MVIERAFIMCLLMSICGFVFCMIFLPLEKFTRNLVSAKTMVTVNTAALLSFVVPFYFAISIKDGTEALLMRNELLVYQDIGGYDGFVCGIREHIGTEYLGFIWLLGVLLVLLYRLLKYFHLMNMIKSQSYRIYDDFWNVKFSDIKAREQVSDVFLVGCCSISTPCTIGIMKKYVVIPSYMINALEEHEAEFILEHEFYHIVSDDILRNFLIMLLSCLNWFNPLYYFLRKNLLEWMEIACDAEVTKNYSKKQRRQYCELIIKVLSLEENRIEEGSFTVNFKGIRNYQRRLSEIMKQNKKSSRIGKVLVTSLVFTALFCGTAAAKEADMSVHMLFSKNIDMVNSDEFTIIESDEIPMEDTFESDIAGAYEETVFVSAEGVTYTVIYNENVPDMQKTPENQIEPNHVHEYVDITIKEHKKNADGSCVTKYYEAQKCTGCGKVVKGKLVQTIISEICNH